MASASAWNPVDSDDELENTEEYRNARTALLVIIDANVDMFRAWGEGDDTPIKAAIKSCHSMWRSKIVSNPKDLVGIVFLGTEHNKNPPGFPNLYVLQNMCSVTVNMIVQLEKMQTSDMDGFCDQIGNSSDFSMRDLFWLAKILFEDAKTTTFSKKILFFTCEDNPHADQINLRNDSISKFNDLGNVDFSIITFNKEFDYDKFYSSILKDKMALTIPTDLDSLVKVVRIKNRLKRPLTRSTLELSPGVSLGVGVYSFVRRALPPRAVKINKRSNEVVTKTINKFRADTGNTILKSEEVKVVQLGGEQVVFTADELKSAKYVYDPGMKILGFLDQSEVDIFTWYHSDGYFIYPDEDRWNGSKDLFTSLLRRCHALKKVAIAKMVMSRGRTPRLGVLIPLVGENIGQNQELPEGFHLLKLPFSDEIRDVTFDWTQEPVPSPVLTDLMEKIVKKVTHKKFDVLAVQNPVLQNKWREIEAAVLDDDGINITQDKFEDYTEPNTLLMRERIGELSRDVMERSASLGEAFRGNSATIAKKPKVAINMAMEAKNRRVDKLTCDILREFLEGKGVKTFRKVKAQLVSEVYKHFGME